MTMTLTELNGIAQLLDATPSHLLDTAGPISPVAVKAAGKIGVIRYVSSIGPPKSITRAEADTYRRAGLHVVLVFEDDGLDPWRGAGAGVITANHAFEQARAAGMPAATPIYSAADTDPHGKEAATDAYYDAFDAQLRKLSRSALPPRHAGGVYGGATLIEHQAARGYRYTWQTVAWSSGVILTKVATIFQGLGNRVFDPDIAFDFDYGQWDFNRLVHDHRHYDWYPLDRRRHGVHFYRERDAAQRYDLERAKAHPDGGALLTHRLHCRYAAERLIHLAKKEFPSHDVGYGLRHRAYHTGFRYKHLVKRATGVAV